MKKKLTTILVLPLIFLSACAEKNWINLLKKGVFEQYDRVKPVGQVFDDWQTCKNTNWEISKSSNDYAEVKYTCEAKGIDKIVATLKANSEVIKENNKLKIRELNQDLTKTRAALQQAACTSDLLLDTVSAGYIVRRSDSLLTDDEWKALLNKYKENENIILDKTSKNLFISEAEVEQYTSKQLELIAKFDHGADFQRTYIFSRGNPEELQDESNQNHKKIQEKLLICLNKIPNVESVKTHGSSIQFYIPEGISTLNNSTAQSLASKVFSLQDELKSYNKQQNYSALKQIKVVVVFGVNENNAEIRQSFIEFSIGENMKQISYTKNEIASIIYSNINLSDELSKLDSVANLF
ncbi:hypothetical protein [Methylophilus sp.]|uniref:hypothetical protein n=1 Tax=Methylophilus sp. TaxID=29541 RepID=UPI000D4E254C|nr:hypothetical protein [Methylophilus sp.]PPD12543.1 MAG: hypothetical protein CTY26_04685 [Methylophilus sp.]